jgi:hypothetical protein
LAGLVSGYRSCIKDSGLGGQLRKYFLVFIWFVLRELRGGERVGGLDRFWAVAGSQALGLVAI